MGLICIARILPQLTALLTVSRSATTAVIEKRCVGALEAEPSVVRMILKLICRKRNDFISLTNFRLAPAPDVLVTVVTELLGDCSCPHVKLSRAPHVVPSNCPHVTAEVATIGVAIAVNWPRKIA